MTRAAPRRRPPRRAAAVTVTSRSGVLDAPVAGAALETMERLSADDARILRLESDAIAGHTLKLAIVEPARDGQPLTVERVRSRVAARLGRLPRARQRLAPTPLRLAAPAWVDDPRLRRPQPRAAPPPGTVSDRAQLMRLVGRVMSERLDHARPLWAINVVGPFSDGRTALVIRVHHCLADGVTFLRLLSELLWDARRRTARRPRPAHGARAARPVGRACSPPAPAAACRASAAPWPGAPGRPPRLAAGAMPVAGWPHSPPPCGASCGRSAPRRPSTAASAANARWRSPPVRWTT